MERRVDHDLWYIECWSFWLDIRILAEDDRPGPAATRRLLTACFGAECSKPPA